MIDTAKAFQAAILRSTRREPNDGDRPRILHCSTEFIASMRKCSLEDAYDWCCEHATLICDRDNKPMCWQLEAGK